jgi:hypothetical protein
MSNTKRNILIVIVLLLVLVFGVGQFFAGSNLNTVNQNSAQTTTSSTGQNTGEPPAPTPTQVFVYSPSASIASSMPVESGSCFASSIAAPYRSDAWRCTVGNAISDPCFVIPQGATLSTPPANLLCGANPTVINATSSFVLQLTKPLPSSTPAAGPTPSNWAWLVQLADGTVCSPFTGTRPFDASGDVAVYSCNGGPNESMIFGDLNNSLSVWTAEIGTLSTSTKTFPPVLVASATVPVASVWQ